MSVTYELVGANPSAAVAPDPTARLEALERLARMRADGLLTDAEYRAEKARLG